MYCYISGLGLSDELLAYVYFPISSFGTYDLWTDMTQNYAQYAEQLDEYDFGQSMLSNLSIKYFTKKNTV